MAIRLSINEDEFVITTDGGRAEIRKAGDPLIKRDDFVRANLASGEAGSTPVPVYIEVETIPD